MWKFQRNLNSAYVKSFSDKILGTSEAKNMEIGENGHKIKQKIQFEIIENVFHLPGRNLIGGYAIGIPPVEIYTAATLPLNGCECAYLISGPSMPCGQWIKGDNQGCGPCIPCDQLDEGACACWKLDCISNYNARELWPIYKAKYSKFYGPCEDERHFKVFKQVVDKAAKENNKLTVTEFTDSILPKL